MAAHPLPAKVRGEGIRAVRHSPSCAGSRTPAWRAIRARRWPASEKRQGTKSRETGHTGATRYGDLIVAVDRVAAGRCRADAGSIVDGLANGAWRQKRDSTGRARVPDDGQGGTLGRAPALPVLDQQSRAAF